MASQFAQSKMNEHASGNILNILLWEFKPVDINVDHNRAVMNHIGMLRKNHLCQW